MSAKWQYEKQCE